MCNLSQGIKERAWEKGRDAGKIEGKIEGQLETFFTLVGLKKLSVSDAAEIAGMPADLFCDEMRKIAESRKSVENR